ncbi:MAG TPA: hypothetical protein VK615_05095 [Candidatus Binatia bacterium]|nr:hypothetical protein [Candidatus Binatia bacterium]
MVTVDGLGQLSVALRDVLQCTSNCCDQFVNFEDNAPQGKETANFFEITSRKGAFSTTHGNGLFNPRLDFGMLSRELTDQCVQLV